MVKKILTLFFAFFLCLFISNKLGVEVQVHAEDAQNAGPSPQVWRCLKGQQEGGHTRTPPPEMNVTLTGRGFASFQDTYIVVCVPTVMGANRLYSSNYKCTSGNPQYDQLLFGSDLTNTISPLTIQVPTGTSPPQVVQSSGDVINVVMHMTKAAGHVNYAFFGVTVNEPQLLPGQGSTIQYGTFTFQQDPSSCISIRWDPFGRIFDSQSLEPMSNVRVTLLDKDKKFLSTPGLRNPETTERDGMYNFFVDIKGTDPQTFFVSPAVPATHTFTAEPNLHPNFEKAYSDIYKPDEPILEYPGVPEHRDVPLDPGSNPPFRSQPKSMSLAAVRLGSWTRYEGVVSHPLSKIKLVRANSGTEVANAEADKDGSWTILVKNDQVPNNENLRVIFTKVDLTTLTYNSDSRKLVKSVSQFFSRLFGRLLSLAGREVVAQSESIEDGGEFPPILPYVEGYAKDKNGNVIANASVRVRMNMSQGVYYQTTADENGFFSIAPQNLPIFNYYLEFTSPNGTLLTRNATTEFTQNNEEYLSSNNINLMAATKDGESLLPPETTTDEASTKPNTSPGANQDKSLVAGKSLNTILTVIALIVLLGVAGGVLVYIRKKKAETDSLL